MDNSEVDTVTDQLERRGLVERCEHGNEHSCSVNAGNCLTG